MVSIVWLNFTKMWNHCMSKFYQNGESLYIQIILKWEIIVCPNFTNMWNHSMAKFARKNNKISPYTEMSDVASKNAAASRFYL